MHSHQHYNILTFYVIFQSAGGLSSGLGIMECARKECQEEASVPDHILDNLKPVGCVRSVTIDL